MSKLNVSRDLVHWALRSGFDHRTEFGSEPTVFFNAGGEERYYLRSSSDESGWVTVTHASRSGDEQYVFEARDLQITERYFWGFFGVGIRSRERLPRLSLPLRLDQVAAGFRIDCTAADETVLLNAAEERIMIGLKDVYDITRLVRTSHWLSITIQELTDSFLDADGRPAFPIQEP